MFSTQLLKKMCLLLSLSLSKSSGGVAFHRPRRRSLFVVTKAVSSSSSPKKRDATPKEENDSTIDVSALSNPSKTANTTGFDSTAFSAFERRFSGRFGAVAREYALREEEKDDVDEKTWWWEGLEIPSRYVHGVGVVPKIEHAVCSRCAVRGERARRADSRRHRATAIFLGKKMEQYRV